MSARNYDAPLLSFFFFYNSRTSLLKSRKGADDTHYSDLKCDITPFTSLKNLSTSSLREEGQTEEE